MTRRPPTTSQTTGETPSRIGAPGLGRTQPQVPERSTPNTVMERPTTESTAPTRSKDTRSSGGMSFTRRSDNRMTPTMTTSPANTHRHEVKVVTAPPTRGPAATAMAPAAAISPYAAGRRSWGKLPATRATMAGMMRAAPRPSNPDQPMMSTVRFGDSAVIADPVPYTTSPMANARRRPMRAPILPPVIMNAAMTNV